MTWFADIGAAYILVENTKEAFKHTEYHGIYRNDKIVIFKGNWNKKDIILLLDWLRTFQERINKLGGTNFLNFSPPPLEVFGSEKEHGWINKRVKEHS